MIMSLAISDCVPEDSPCPLQGNLLQCIDKAKALGYDGVELHMRNARLNDYHEIAEHAARTGVKVTTIGTGMAYYADGHYMTNPDKEARRQAAQVLIDFLEAGSIAGGAAVMFGLMKGPLPDPHQRELYKDRLFQALLPVAEAAEKYQCDLTIEAINRFQSPYLWTAEETLEFVRRFQSKRVTVHLDTFHMNIEERDMRQAIESCGSHLGHFHFSDSDRCYPGHGHVDFAACIDALQRIGYLENGLGGHEYIAGSDGASAAARGLNYIRDIIKKRGLDGKGKI